MSEEKKKIDPAIKDSKDLPLIDRVKRMLCRRYECIEEGKRYDGVKQWFAELMMTVQRYEIQELKKGPPKEDWVCPRCKRKMHIYSDEDLKVLREGKDPRQVAAEEDEKEMELDRNIQLIDRGPSPK